MPALAALFFFAAPQFWDAKPPRQWTDMELARLLHDSPWAQMAPPPPKNSGSPAEQIYIATAQPIREAEVELARRRAIRLHTGEGFDREYRDFLEENGRKRIILATYVPNLDA